MNTSPVSSNNQDPDYASSAPESEKQQKLYEENARSTTARKITAIIEKEFSREIDIKEKEVLHIQDKLQKALKTLHLLRYVIITDFYNRKQCLLPQNGEIKQSQIHPAIKQLIGKSPTGYYDPTLPATSTTSQRTNKFDISLPSTSREANVCRMGIETEDKKKSVKNNQEVYLGEKRRQENNDSVPKKIPRYVPPKSGVPEPISPARGIRHKVRKRIVVGNISKWIPPDWREDAASHKWTMYVRGSKDDSDIAKFVSKVRFFLHPSYQPNDVVEVTSPPFHLCRRGWGEFPLRVQLHFKSALNKPMDIIHHLKLDRTYTGLQTLGSETVVDIWLYTSEFRSLDSTHINDNNSTISSIDKEKNLGNNEKSLQPITTGKKNNMRTNQRSSGKSEMLVVQNLTKSISSENVHDLFNKSFKKPNDSQNSASVKFAINNIKTESRESFITKPKFANCLNLALKIEPDDYIHDISIKKTATSMHAYDNTDKHKERLLSNIYFDHNYTAFNGFQTQKNHLHTQNFECSSKKSINSENTQLSLLGKQNLKPLKISIPEMLSISTGKKVLIMNNDKLVSTNTSDAHINSRIQLQKLSSNIECIKKKISSTQPGISILKRTFTNDTKPEANNSILASSILKIKPSNSLFLNCNYNEPALKIVDSSARIYQIENEDKSKKIILGKDREKLQSKRELYEEMLRSINEAKISDVEGLIRFIIRRLPIITTNAIDSDYKRFHPYSCRSEDEFKSYNIGKQKALEWYRAKMISALLRKKLGPSENLWSVKEIIIWSRLHGYTPFNSGFHKGASVKGIKNIPESNNRIRNTCTEPIEFKKIIQNQESFNQEEEQEEIDILEVDKLDKIKTNCIRNENIECEKPNDMLVLELDEKMVPLYNFVSETARDIGIKLDFEEIVPNVVHCAAGRMIMKAIECLVEDLSRSSLAKAWERSCNNRCPNTVTLEDVRAAIGSREEYDVFTNEGLGTGD
ncbi:uncharacterized protein D12 [Prorops nasuta]|uniref:uncharacterized protein D12 n=1 Tax=Prorops nasuta TaxID=863751 RepID=UPI0034CF0170